MDLKHIIMELVKSKISNSFRLSLFSLFLFGLIGCSFLFGIYPITENVYYWDAGTPKERLIIFNNKDDLHNIVSGIPIVPSNLEFQKNCELCYTEYVKEYSYDGKWLLASTVLFTDSNSLTRYWIVKIPDNMEHGIDEITKSTFGPLNYYEFDSIILFYGINESKFSSHQ